MENGPLVSQALISRFSSAQLSKVDCTSTVRSMYKYTDNVSCPKYAPAGYIAYTLAIGKDPGGDQLVRVALGEPFLEDRARRGRVVLRRAQEAAHIGGVRVSQYRTLMQTVNAHVQVNNERYSSSSRVQEYSSDLSISLFTFQVSQSESELRTRRRACSCIQLAAVAPLWSRG